MDSGGLGHGGYLWITAASERPPKPSVGEPMSQFYGFYFGGGGLQPPYNLHPYPYCTLAYRSSVVGGLRSPSTMVLARIEYLVRYTPTSSWPVVPLGLPASGPHRTRTVLLSGPLTHHPKTCIPLSPGFRPMFETVRRWWAKFPWFRSLLPFHQPVPTAESELGFPSCSQKLLTQGILSLVYHLSPLHSHCWKRLPETNRHSFFFFCHIKMLQVACGMSLFQISGTKCTKSRWTEGVTDGREM